MFTACSMDTRYVVKLMTACGGMSNGNAYQEVELHYLNKEVYDDGEDFQVAFLVEHGRHGYRKKLCDHGYIVYGEGDGFDIIRCNDNKKLKVSVDIDFDSKKLVVSIE